MRSPRVCARVPRRTTGTARESGAPPRAEVYRRSGGGWTVRFVAVGTRRRRERSRAARADVELRAQLGLAFVHRGLALGDRLGDELAQIEETASGLAGDRRGRHPLRLLPGPPRGEHGSRGAGPQAERDPEAALHYFFPLETLLATFRRPAPKLMIFTSGLAVACSISPEIFSTRATTTPADWSMPSTRSSSRFVRSTVPTTSLSSGTVSSRNVSMVILVLVSTLNVPSRTTHRTSTSNPQNAARTTKAVSP